MVATAKQIWFKMLSLTGKEIEYSTDFKFFMREQIAFSSRGIYYKFYSRLDGKRFRSLNTSLQGYRDFTDEEIEGICKEIHSEILSGKHGEGKLID